MPVDPWRLLRVTGAVVLVAVALNAISLAVRLLALRGGASDQAVRWLSVDAEANLPTLVNALLLLLSACASWALAATARRDGVRWWRHWALLAAAFAYLTLDELATIHEEGIGLVARYVERSGVLTFGWVLLAAPLVVVFALVNVSFLRWLPARTRWLLVAAGALYVTGALGLEMVSGHLADGRSPDLPSATDPVGYVLASQVEELLEVLGTGLYLHALGVHARTARLLTGRRTPTGTPDRSGRPPGVGAGSNT